MQPLRDESGTTVALCVEIHDAAFSKFVAGRDKDWVFLREAWRGGYLDTITFVARLRLLQDMPQAVILRPRLKQLLNSLATHRDLRPVIDALQAFARELNA